MNAIRILFVLALAPAAQAQVSELWNAVYDGPQSQADWGYKTCSDAAGNVYVTGRSLNPSVGFPPPPPSDDTITLKYDSTGNLLWAARFDGFGGDDNGRDVAIDPADGSVYSAGYSSGYVGGNYVTDIRLIKYDANGNQLWTRAWDGPGASADFARALRLDAAGNVFVAGYSYNLAGNPDGVVLRYDPAGNLVWATLVDGTAHQQDYFATLALGPGGFIYAVGQGNSSGSSADMLLAKLDSAGALVWQRTFDGGGSGLEYALGVAVDGAGAAYVSGWTSTLAGGQDAALFKYDTNGVFQWSRTIDGSAHTTDQGNEVALDALGNVWISGYLNQGATKQDFLLAKYDTSGTPQWQRTWDSPAHLDDLGQFLVVDADGSATVAGNSAGASGQATDRDIVAVHYDRDGNLRWAYTRSSPGIDDDRPYDLAPGAGGTLVLTGSTHGATQYLQDVWTIVLKDQAQRFCFGDGVAAGCPCANNSAPGDQRGCINSTGVGAQLLDSGAASLANDTLVLTSSGELPSALSVFLQGTAQVVTPLTFGDGLRCAGGALKRLYIENASGGVVSAPAVGNPSVSQQSANLGDPLSVGSRRYLQTYYRDPSTSFCPAPPGNTWNVSSGLVLDWAP